MARPQTPPPAPAARLVTRPSDQVIELRDASGRLVAHYNPKTNQTRNDRGDLIGTGNRLGRILQALAAVPGVTRRG